MSLNADLLDRIRTAILVLDSNFTIQYMNSAAEDFCGGSGEYFRCRPLSQLISGPDVQDSDLRRCIDEYGIYTLREAELLVLPTKTNAIANVAVSAIDENQLLLEIEPLDRILLINKGYRMKDTQAANRQLIRGMAHEIKNPLGGIRGAAQLLQKESTTRGRQELTEVIIDEVERLRTLVDQLLGPKNSPVLKSINLHAVVERVIRLIESDERVDFSIERTYDPSMPEVAGDLDQLVQALLNIVKNAQEAISDVDEPTLSIKTRVEHQFTIGAKYHPIVAHLAISDNGGGIPSEMQRQIFLPLVTTKSTGTGLGLAITQSIIDTHQGLITCDSVPGRTNFDIYLPFATN